jgi:putative sulfotransferase
MILRGTLDTMVPEEDAHVLHAAIPASRFVPVPGAGHFPYLTHPETVNAHVTPFLEAHSDGRLTAMTTVTERTAAGAPGGAASADELGRCIVIGTGRCGSTLLSDLLNEERETLSVSESLSAVRGRMLVVPLNVFTGAQYWSMLSQPSQKHGHLLSRIGLTGPQFSYPDTGRFGRDLTRVPPILRIALPKISGDPDRIFDILDERVPQFPAQPVARHHRMLLDLLAVLEGRKRWVERTGASSMVAHPWMSANPDAKIIYLTRNTRDTAKSMSKHPVFQMSAVRHEFHVRYGTDPYVRILDKALPADIPEEMRRLMPDNLTAEGLRGLETDLSFYESMVEQMNGAAEQALDDLQPSQLYRIRYEDIQADPVTELTRLGEFIGLSDPGEWADRVGGRVRPARTPAPEPAA